MLKLIDHISQLKFSELMLVYEETNILSGREDYPRLTESEQIQEAEQDFYRYLRAVFFKQENARYAVWEEKNRYYSAVRLEPYQDGFLLCALETAPDYRRKGYAKALIQALQKQLKGVKLYSHISKNNIASMMLHNACGFHILNDWAVYVDGSVFRDSVTMVCICEKTESF